MLGGSRDAQPSNRNALSEGQRHPSLSLSLYYHYTAVAAAAVVGGVFVVLAVLS